MTKFSRTQKFTKANIANVPQDKAIIYKIKSKDGENLYTGYAQVKTKDRAHQIEKSIIKKEQPEHNEHHK